MLVLGCMIAALGMSSALNGTWQLHIGQRLIDTVAAKSLEYDLISRPEMPGSKLVASLAANGSEGGPVSVSALRLSRTDATAMSTGMQSPAAMQSGMTGLATLFGEICEVNPETILAGFTMAADLLQAKTVLLFGHLLGMGMGLTTTTYLAFFYLAAIRRGYQEVGSNSRARSAAFWMRVGLFLVLATGIGLMINLHLTSNELVYDPKLWVKFGVTGALLATMALFGLFASHPQFLNDGRPLFEATSLPGRTVAIILFGGILASWWYLLALGISREYSFTLNGQTMLLGYAYGLAIAMALAIFMALFAGLFRPSSVSKRKYMHQA